MTKNEPHIVEGRLYVPYNNFYGALASRFYQELRDNKKIMATKCLSCKKVFMPPRSVCPDCFIQLKDWVELPPTGTLLSYTQVNYTYSTYYQPRKAPYLVGIIKLEGADTALTHLLGDVELGDVKIGMKLKAVFRNRRKGDILDIAYFKPAKKVIKKSYF